MPRCAFEDFKLYVFSILGPDRFLPSDNNLHVFKHTGFVFTFRQQLLQIHVKLLHSVLDVSQVLSDGADFKVSKDPLSDQLSKHTYIFTTILPMLGEHISVPGFKYGKGRIPLSRIRIVWAVLAGSDFFCGLLIGLFSASIKKYWLVESPLLSICWFNSSFSSLVAHIEKWDLMTTFSCLPGLPFGFFSIILKRLKWSQAISYEPRGE